MRNAYKIIVRKPKWKIRLRRSVNCGTSQWLQELPPLYFCNITLKYTVVQNGIISSHTYCMFLYKVLCIFVVIFSFIFCSKQCRKATYYEPQLYVVSHTLQQGRTHLWCWGQCHIHNILHIRIWLPPTTVDTDFIFTISKTESAAVLHHLFNVSDKTVCHHYHFTLRAT